MSRFYNTSNSNPIDWAYKLPYQEMLNSLTSKQSAQDSQRNFVDSIQAMGENIYYLNKDKDAALSQVDWLNKNINEFSNLDLTDPTNRNKLKDFSKEVTRRWGNNGIVGNIKKSVDSRNAYLQQLQENKNLSNEQKLSAIQYWDNAYSGINDQSPYLGNYNTYSGQQLSNFVNVADEWMKLSKNIEPDKITEGGSSIGNMYIKDWEKFRSSTPKERVQMVWEGFLNREDISNYIKDGLQYGYFNPESLNNIYSAGYAQLGNESKSTSKLHADSWQIKKADWAREDSLMVDNYTNLYSLLKERGVAELDGTTVKALFPDGSVSLSDGIIFGGTGPLANKSQKELETLKEMSELFKANYDLNNGKFSWSRFMASMNNYGFGPEKGFNATSEEIQKFNDMLKVYADKKGITTDEVKERIKTLGQGLTSEQKQALVKASFAFQSNLPVTISGSQSAGAKVVDNSAYVSVNTDLVPLSATGLSEKEVNNINKQLGGGDYKPFTIIKKDDNTYVSIKMNVKHDFNQAASLNYNKETGANHDARTVNNFISTVDYYRGQDMAKQLYDNTPAGTEPEYIPVDINGTIQYLPNPKFNK